MPKTNEADLRKALFAIIKADTGTGGVLEIMQEILATKTADDMVVEWGDPRLDATKRPVLALATGIAPPNTGSKERIEPDVQIGIFTERAAQDVPERILDRLEEIIDYNALNAQGIQSIPWSWIRIPFPDAVGREASLRKEGEKVLVMRSEFWLER